MKFFFFFFLFPIFTYAQEVLRIEMEDVENFDYIKYDLVLDEKDSILNIEIDKKGTSYKNESNILKLKNNFSKFRKKHLDLQTFPICQIILKI